MICHYQSPTQAKFLSQLYCCCKGIQAFVFKGELSHISIISVLFAPHHLSFESFCKYMVVFMFLSEDAHSYKVSERPKVINQYTSLGKKSPCTAVTQNHGHNAGHFFHPFFPSRALRVDQSTPTMPTRVPFSC